MTISKPDKADAPEYFHYYIDLVEGNDLIHALEADKLHTVEFIRGISVDKADYRYAEGKWTVKDVIQHVIDSERIFAYRALRFSRRDHMPLPGFDENFYVANVDTFGRSLENLLAEFQAVRQATIALYAYMNDAMLDFKATANGVENTARAMGWMIIGHNKHHVHILQERYLN